MTEWCCKCELYSCSLLVVSVYRLIFCFQTYMTSTIHIMFVRRVDEDHSSHLGVVGVGSGECADG